MKFTRYYSKIILNSFLNSQVVAADAGKIRSKVRIRSKKVRINYYYYYRSESGFKRQQQFKEKELPLSDR